MNPNDLELLSAYIDGTLSAEERAAVAARLADEADLRRGLASLQATVSLLGALPELRSPRDLSLTRAMVNPPVQRKPPIALFSALSAAAAFVLIALGVIGLGSGTLSAPESAQVAAIPTSTILIAPPASATLSPSPTEASEVIAESLEYEAAPGSDAADQASFSQRSAETNLAPTQTMLPTIDSLMMDAQPVTGDAMLTQPPMQIMQALGGAEMQEAPAEDVLNFAAVEEMAAPAAAGAAPDSQVAAGSIAAAVPMPQGTLPLPTMAPLATQTRAEQPADTSTSTHTFTATSTNTATPEPSETPVPTATSEPTPAPQPADSADASQNDATLSIVLIVAGVLLLLGAVVLWLRRPQN